jgi:hypothetical protein
MAENLLSTADPPEISPADQSPEIVSATNFEHQKLCSHGIYSTVLLAEANSYSYKCNTTISYFSSPNWWRCAHILVYFISDH